MNPRTYEALAKISSGDWERINLDLTRYALSVSRHLRWRTANTMELPGGETVDSVVSKALEKLFSGEREWNPEKDPDLGRYLRNVIDSLLNHLAVSHDNVKVTRRPEKDSSDAKDWESGSLKRDPSSDWLAPVSRTPEAMALAREQAQIEDRALDLLLDSCKEDQMVMTVLEANMDGIDAPSEIATAKNLSVKDVYKAVKRMDRKLEALRKRLHDESAASGRGSPV